MMLAEEIQTTFEVDKTSWTKVKLGDVVREVRETVKDPVAEGIERIVGLEHLEPESLHIRTWGTLTDSTTFTKVFRKGQVLFGRRRAYLKKAALATFDGICSGDITVLEAKKGLLPELLPFLIQNDKFFELAVKNSAGSLSPRAKFADFADYEYLLPPIEQQEQIAELLWAGDETVEKYFAVIDSTSKLKMSMLSSYFIHAHQTIRLSEIGKVITGSTPATKKSEYWGGDIPFVTPADIDDSPYIKKTERFVTELGAEVSRAIPENAILTVCIGSTIGKVSITNQKCVTNQQINAIIPKPEFQPEFILYTLRFFKGKIMERVGATAVPIINKSEFESIELPLLELKERKELVLKVNAIDQVINKASEQLAYFTRAHKAIINQIF